VATFARDRSTGALSQLTGTAACITETGTGGCADGRGLLGAIAVAVSPDGKHVYVASADGNAVAALVRDATTGALTQRAATAGCVNESGLDGCADGKALLGAHGIAVSPDGKHVYVVSSTSLAVAAFSRDKATGALTQLAGTAGCASATGTAGDCATAKALADPRGIAASPDGKHVYVASLTSDALAVFARDRTTGALTQLDGLAGCVSQGGSGGECTSGKGLDSPWAVAVTRDGKHVYATSFEGVAAFSRDKRTGALTQLPGTAGCVSDSGTSGDCTDGRVLGNGQIRAAAPSPDGRNLYVTAGAAGAVAAFARDKTTGALTQLPGTAGCVSEDGSSGECADATLVAGASSITVSPDGRHVYVTTLDGDGIALFARD
jgi:6-phosphogluconolactonase (cycloisomerase 2 family)